MPKRTTAQQVTELTDIFQRILYIGPHLKAVLPENMVAMKAYIEEERRKGKAGTMNFNLFYNIGVILKRQPEPVTMGEFSYALNVPLSTATRIVDWMTDHDYVQRQHDPDDRRVVRISLTDNGQELYNAINHFVHERVEFLLSKFAPAEREDLITLMHKLMDALESANARDEGVNP